MNYLEENNIDEAICQNLSNKDVLKSDMRKIYNLIVGQTNEQLQEKAASDATLQAVKTDRDPICYLIILKKLCFKNQCKNHPIRSLCLSTRCLYNTMQYANKNTTKYLFRFRNDQKVNDPTWT